MSRIITFSTVFPAYHPRKGEPTFFVEKILNGIAVKRECGIVDRDLIPAEVQKYVNDFVLLGTPEDIKHHTIRAGKRWKVGDKFSPRIWGDNINPKTGKKGAYQSKQIQFAPDIKIKKIWDIEIEAAGNYTQVRIPTKSANVFSLLSCGLVAANDGLDVHDFINWFPKNIVGQIICWNENIEYA